LQELYIVSRQLAIAVIPNEYGIDPQGKLRIGSRIATEVSLHPSTLRPHSALTQIVQTVFVTF